MHRAGVTLACLVAIGTVGGLAGCNAEEHLAPPSGLAGLSLTDDGEYVVDLFVCNGKVDTVDIVRDRQGLKETEENPPVQRYTSSRPVSGLVTLNVNRPGTAWAPSTPTVFEAGKGFIVTGEGSEGHDIETSQLNVHASALGDLVPGFVYVSADASSS
jgi:hypothetical protein